MNNADGGLFLYMVRFCTGGLDMYNPAIYHEILSVGTDEANAIEKVRHLAKTECNPKFTAEKVEDVMGMAVSIKAPARETPALGDFPHVAFGPDTPTLTVCVGNAAKPEIGEATIPLPITAEELRPWLEGLEIDPRAGRGVVVKEVRSPQEGLGPALFAGGAVLEELNYLAANIAQLSDENRAAFVAVVESGMYGGDVTGLINAALNLDSFYLQPAYSPAQYGAFLMEAETGRFADTLNQLEQHGDDDERELAAFINQMSQCVDFEKFGERTAREECGVFTDMGYLTAQRNVPEAYRFAEDIPADRRLFAPDPEAAASADLTKVLAEIHAVGGYGTQDLKRNLYVLDGGGDVFFVLKHANTISVASVESLFYEGHPERERLLSQPVATDERVVALSVAEREDGRILGHIGSMRLSVLQAAAREHLVPMASVDAEFNGGGKRAFTADEWRKLALIVRDKIQRWTTRYEQSGEDWVRGLSETITRECRKAPESPDAQFMAEVGADYMARAENPRLGMLRLAQDAAREILAKDMVPVYALTLRGTEKLLPLDAARTGLNHASYREFAVKAEDFGGVEKWAEKASRDALFEIQFDRERGRRRKAREEEI